MSNRILVTYATVTGSTPGVAEAIAKTLNEHGFETDLRPMREVHDLSAYSAVVAGSAIQSSAWLPEAVAFVQTHQAALRQKPFAAFLVCMTLAMKNAQWKQQADVSKFLDPVRALVKPAAEGYFAGALDLKKIPQRAARFGFRLSILFGMWSEGDHRDWNAIRTWAASLPPLLQV